MLAAAWAALQHELCFLPTRLLELVDQGGDGVPLCIAGRGNAVRQPVQAFVQPRERIVARDPFGGLGERLRGHDEHDDPIVAGRRREQRPQIGAEREALQGLRRDARAPLLLGRAVGLDPLEPRHHGEAAGRGEIAALDIAAGIQRRIDELDRIAQGRLRDAARADEAGRDHRTRRGARRRPRKVRHLWLGSDAGGWWRRWRRLLRLPASLLRLGRDAGCWWRRRSTVRVEPQETDRHEDERAKHERADQDQARWPAHATALSTARSGCAGSSAMPSDTAPFYTTAVIEHEGFLADGDPNVEVASACGMVRSDGGPPMLCERSLGDRP